MADANDGTIIRDPLNPRTNVAVIEKKRSTGRKILTAKKLRLKVQNLRALALAAK
jgi:hypothetical protein